MASLKLPCFLSFRFTVSMTPCTILASPTVKSTWRYFVAFTTVLTLILKLMLYRVAYNFFFKFAFLNSLQETSKW